MKFIFYDFLSTKRLYYNFAWKNKFMSPKTLKIGFFFVENQSNGLIIVSS